MSKYIRDDKKFREQIAALADAGLNFPTNPTMTQPANFGGVPAYVRIIESSDRVLSPVVHYEIAPKGRLPEMVAGLVIMVPVALVLLVTLYYFIHFGGAH
jgi:hypothetical protein